MNDNGIKTNERELSNKITEWFNDVLKHGTFPIKSATTETGIKTGGKTFFGDVVLWKNRETEEAICYFELKPPFAAKENLERFRKKALQLKVKVRLHMGFSIVKSI